MKEDQAMRDVATHDKTPVRAARLTATWTMTVRKQNRGEETRGVGVEKRETVKKHCIHILWMILVEDTVGRGQEMTEIAD